MKVLIVDDNQLIRMGLRVSLEMQESVSQIFEAENGEEAIAIATREAVDITILDVSMPVMGGLDALEQLIPHCPVVMLTNEDDAVTVAQAMKNGASGYIVHGSLEPATIVGRFATLLTIDTIIADLALYTFSVS